mmetsp:Transcript_64848/g.180225  ORF Transcript_64848/g.180225 Transcript_64848/m.180225 type:complete len:110 (+) Transcript_64848:835-1164(+)
MTLTLVSSAFQVILGRQKPQTSISYVQIFVLSGVFLGILFANLQVLLYIRFGLRKKLGLVFMDVSGNRRYSAVSGKTQTSTTMVAPEPTSGQNEEPAPGNLESTPVEEI